MKISKHQMVLWVLVVASFWSMGGVAAPADEKAIGVAPGRPRVIHPTVDPNSSLLQSIEERLATGSNRSGVVYRKTPVDLAPPSEHKNSDQGLKREKKRNLLPVPIPLAVPNGIVSPLVPTAEYPKKVVEYPKREESIPISAPRRIYEPTSRPYDRETSRDTGVGYSRTIYYPGYLPDYSHGGDGFVYDSSPSLLSPPEVVITPPPPSRAKKVPDALPVSSVAAFMPNQAVISRVLLSGFSVHVGSFIEYEQAIGLEERLLEQGIPFFRTPVLLNGISYLQLHAGPFQERYMAESMEIVIKDTLSIDGRLLFYGQ